MLCHAAMCVQGQARTRIKVYDQAKKLPLEYVTVSTDKDWLATTDSTGSASIISAAGPRKIVFSLTGYKRKDTVLTLPGSFSIYMTPDVAALEEVTEISTTRNEMAKETSPAM